MIEKEFVERRNIIIDNPQPPFSDKAATTAWDKLTDELYDNPVNPDCLTDSLRDTYPGPQGEDGVLDYHVHSPDFAFFARSRFSLLLDHTYYIAIVEEGEPYLRDIEIDGISDNYYKFEYPLTVVENLRGELPSELEVEVIFRTEDGSNSGDRQVVWGICRDKKTKKWRTTTWMIDSFPGEGGLEYLKEKIKTTEWKGGDDCRPPYFEGPEDK